MVDQAMERYCIEHKLPLSNKNSFYFEKPSIYTGTSAYLARVCGENLLNFTNKIGLEYDWDTESNCHVS